jgi:AcrR family transcriptional regulator
MEEGFETRSGGGDKEARRPGGRPRSESARRAILRASLDLLRRDGINGVTAEAVAERAKVSKATLYRWWPCAAATAMDAFFDEVFARLRTVASDDPIEDLRARFRQGARLMAGELGDVLAGLIATTHTDPRLAQSFRERYVEPAREDLRRLLRRAVDAGALRPDLDIEAAIDVCSGPFFYRRMVCHEPTSVRRMETILDHVLQGLAPRAKPAGRRSATAPARRNRGAAVHTRARRPSVARVRRV